MYDKSNQLWHFRTRDSVQLGIDLLNRADLPLVHKEGRFRGAKGDGGVQEFERTRYDQGGGSRRNIHPCEQFLSSKQQLGQLKVQGIAEYLHLEALCW